MWKHRILAILVTWDISYYAWGIVTIWYYFADHLLVFQTAHVWNVCQNQASLWFNLEVTNVKCCYGFRKWDNEKLQATYIWRDTCFRLNIKQLSYNLSTMEIRENNFITQWCCGQEYDSVLVINWNWDSAALPQVPQADIVRHRCSPSTVHSPRTNPLPG